MVPNSEGNPSAWPGHRCRAWDRSWKQARVTQALPATLADHRRQLGERGDVGQLVEGEHDRRARAGSRPVAARA